MFTKFYKLKSMDSWGIKGCFNIKTLLPDAVNTTTKAQKSVIFLSFSMELQFFPEAFDTL